MIIWIRFNLIFCLVVGKIFLADWSGHNEIENLIKMSKVDFEKQIFENFFLGLGNFFLDVRQGGPLLKFFIFSKNFFFEILFFEIQFYQIFNFVIDPEISTLKICSNDFFLAPK